MEELSFKKLEKIVNEEGIKIIDRWNGDEELSSTYNSNLIQCVKNKIEEVLDRYGISHNELHTTDYRGRIYLMNYLDSWAKGTPTGIEVKIKKTKDKEKSNCLDTYFIFKNIEVEVAEVYEPGTTEIIKLETIRDYIDYKKKCNKLVQDEKDKKISNFIKNLDGLDFEKFIKLYKEFNNLDYVSKTKVFEKYGIDDRYMYL